MPSVICVEKPRLAFRQAKRKIAEALLASEVTGERTLAQFYASLAAHGLPAHDLGQHKLV